MSDCGSHTHFLTAAYTLYVYVWYGKGLRTDIRIWSPNFLGYISTQTHCQCSPTSSQRSHSLAYSSCAVYCNTCVSVCVCVLHIIYVNVRTYFVCFHSCFTQTQARRAREILKLITTPVKCSTIKLITTNCFFGRLPFAALILTDIPLGFSLTHVRPEAERQQLRPSQGPLFRIRVFVCELCVVPRSSREHICGVNELFCKTSARQVMRALINQMPNGVPLVFRNCVCVWLGWWCAYLVSLDCAIHHPASSIRNNKR